MKKTYYIIVIIALIAAFFHYKEKISQKDFQEEITKDKDVEYIEIIDKDFTEENPEITQFDDETILVE